MKKFFLTSVLAFLSLWSVNAQDLYNALRFSPIGMSEMGNTVGLEYQRYAKNNPRLSFILPVEYVFEQIGVYEREERSLPYFYVRPGIKIYPASIEKVFRYAFGFNMAMGYGQIQRNYSRYSSSSNNSGFTIQEKAKENFRIGFMATNYFNFDIGRTITMGLHLGLGMYYSNKDVGGRRQQDRAAIQVGANFGFKF